MGGSGKAARGVEDAAPYAPPYGSRRGEHCSPENLTWQRISGKATHKGNEHGRTLCAPTEHFFRQAGLPCVKGAFRLRCRGEQCSPAGSCVTAQPHGSIWNTPLRSKQSRDALTGRRGGFYIHPWGLALPHNCAGGQCPPLHFILQPHRSFQCSASASRRACSRG